MRKDIIVGMLLLCALPGLAQLKVGGSGVTPQQTSDINRAKSLSDSLKLVLSQATVLDLTTVIPNRFRKGVGNPPEGETWLDTAASPKRVKWTYQGITYRNPINDSLNGGILNNLAGYYKFNETSGSLIDRSGNGRNGTIVGSVTQSATGYTFSGGYIVLPTNIITGNKFSVFGRNQVASNSARKMILSSNGGSGGVGISYNDAGGLDLNRPFTQGMWAAGNFVTLNTDMDFCITYDGTTGIAKFYKNGVLVETSSPTIVTFTAGGATRIGDTGGDTFFGSMKLLGIYDGRVLTDAEVAYVRNNALFGLNEWLIYILLLSWLIQRIRYRRNTLWQ